MTTDIPQTPLSPEELLQRRKTVRTRVLLRGVLLGALIAAWWIFFAPDSLMEPELKKILGVVAGLVATGSYLFNLRDALFLRPSATAPKQGAAK